MPRLQFKSFATPDEDRRFPMGNGRIVKLDESTVGIASWEPGWRWSTHLAPIAGTTSCQVHHLGYAISGRLRVVMDDGQSIEIPPDSAYEIPAGHDASVVGDESFVTLEWTSAHLVGVGGQGAIERVLATVLFTDIVGSSARAAELGDRAWRRLLEGHHARVRRELTRFRGEEKDTAGDGFFATFDGPARAIRCAEAIVDGVRELGLEVRAGVHTGECELHEGKVAGLAVVIGARVAAAARGGEVLVSQTVRDLVAGAGLDFVERGPHRLKGVPGEWRLYAVTHA
jgi:class 3 adenylate cyclase